MTEPRFPLDPLAHAAGIELGQVGGHQPGQHLSGNARLAELVGVTPRWARQLRHTGLTEAQADHAATALGMHPLEIWPTEWADALHNAHLPPAGRRNAAKAHCPQGHPYSRIDSRGRRCCQPCNTEKVREIRSGRSKAQRVQVVTQLELWEAS